MTLAPPPLFRVLVASIALGLAGADAQAQQDQPRNDWVRIDGAKATAEGASLVVERGLVHTARLLPNVIAEFDYRALDERSEVSLWVLGLVTASGRTGYEVALLTGRSGAVVGGITSTGATMTLVETRAAPDVTPDGWRHVAVSLRNGQMAITIDDVVVIRAEALSRATGHMGFERQSGRGIEIRGFRTASLPGDEGTDDFGATPKLEPDSGITPPELVHNQRPSYTASAMSRRVEGTVSMEGLITETGAIGAPRVIDSLDEGLDQKALAAARLWRFKPAMRNGQAIAVRVRIILDFKLLK